jgi:hypothetical protein
MAAGYTRYVTARGGVLTWDVPFLANGTISPPFIGQLTAVGNIVN